MIRGQEGTAPLYLECRKKRGWLKEWGITVPCCTSGRESSSKPSTPGFGPLSLHRIRSSVGTVPPFLANSASLELSLLEDDFAGSRSSALSSSQLHFPSASLEIPTGFVLVLFLQWVCRKSSAVVSMKTATKLRTTLRALNGTQSLEKSLLFS
ncbi:hypothetical protein C8R44DRAFT_731309 [Mycena epipterygia]|nr:hypothetical protein C8R44DRAFT_731309 [Mycena epipterygia]